MDPDQKLPQDQGHPGRAKTVAGRVQFLTICHTECHQIQGYFYQLILTISGRSTKKITILVETNGGKIVTQIVTKIGDYSIT